MLVPGATIEAEIGDSAPEVHTPTLDANYPDAPTVGVAYRIAVAGPGPYYIDLRSYDFDAYLVLRDAEGNVLAEDHDGLISVHARLVVELEAGQGLRLEVCALHGARGAYALRSARRAVSLPRSRPWT